MSEGKEEARAASNRLSQNKRKQRDDVDPHQLEDMRLLELSDYDRRKRASRQQNVRAPAITRLRPASRSVRAMEGTEAQAKTEAGLKTL